MKVKKIFPPLLLLCLFYLAPLSNRTSLVFAQFAPVEDIDFGDDDLNIGGDIFSDFNEQLEDEKMMEDERFYRYGRFFSVQLSLGLTTFDGNRGTAYDNEPPTFGFGLNYFADFRSSYGLGFEFSRHNMFFPDPIELSPNAPGFVTVNMLRVYFSYRYYIDTADLGTAITWANPYFTGRMEYWYTTNKFIDQPTIPDDTGGGLGVGLGFGFEFPIKLRESYIGVELLFHSVNFHDKFTQAYRKVEDEDDKLSKVGFKDLSGNAYSTKISYVISW